MLLNLNIILSLIGFVNAIYFSLVKWDASEFYQWALVFIISLFLILYNQGKKRVSWDILREKAVKYILCFIIIEFILYLYVRFNYIEYSYGREANTEEYFITISFIYSCLLMFFFCVSLAKVKK